MNKLLLVGIKDEPYVSKTTGELVRSRELHFISEPPEQKSDTFRGREVMTQRCNFDVSGLTLMAWYEPVWQVKQFKTGQFAFLADLKLVPENEIPKGE